MLNIGMHILIQIMDTKPLDMLDTETVAMLDILHEANYWLDTKHVGGLDPNVNN